MSLIDEVNNRRTFAIISHPDAGKTTLTEKLLLYGGAIHWPVPSRPARRRNMPFRTGWKLKNSVVSPSPVRSSSSTTKAIISISSTRRAIRTSVKIRTGPSWLPTAPSCSSTSPKASKPRRRSSSASVKNGASPFSPSEQDRPLRPQPLRPHG